MNAIYYSLFAKSYCGNIADKACVVAGYHKGVRIYANMAVFQTADTQCQYSQTNDHVVMTRSLTAA